MQVHVVEGYIQNIFVIEYPDKCLLLDGCCRADFDTLQTFFTQTLRRPFTDLKTVVITHMHPDHAGCASLLKQRLGCQLISARKEKPWYSGLSGSIAHFTDMLLALWVASKMQKAKKNLWYSRKLDVDHYVEDGDHVPNFPEWTVYETPGHTDRDLSLMHVPTKRIYVADLIVKVKGKLTSPAPVHYPELYKNSLVKVQHLAPNSVMMAHVPESSLSYEDFQTLINRAPLKPETNVTAISGILKRKILR